MNSFTSQDEIFDVVDEHDQVIGSNTRGQVHALGLRHRAVHILVYNAQGAVFLQKRSPAKDRFPNCWDCSTSGHVDSGEDYDTAAWRELGEEIGYTDRSLPLRPFAKLEAHPITGQEFIQLYVLGPCAGPFYLNPAEITEGRFFTPEEVDALCLAPGSVAGAFGWWWPRYQALLAGFLTG